MKQTQECINKVLSEIENSSLGKNTTVADEVMEKLLGRRSEFSEKEENREHLTTMTEFCPTASDKKIFAYTKDKIQDINQIDRWQIQFNRPLASERPIIGKLIIFCKRCIRFLCRPIVGPIVDAQNQFNATAVQTLNGLFDIISDDKLEIQKMKKQIQQLKKAVECYGGEYEDVYDVIEYDKFESYFRGTEEEIRKKQEEYIPYLLGKKRVIDIGCGRGEFLQLLCEHGISAAGVEHYDKFVKECRRKGLEVYEQDGIDYIDHLQELSVDGIVAFQVVEHLRPAEIVRLCNLSYNKLKKGGVLIFETPNPTCLSIYTNSFYMDMSHQKPVHPLTLKFFLETAGFTNITVMYPESSRVPYRLPLLEIENFPKLSEYNDAINGLTDLIWGSQDYAIIATK